MIKFRVADYVMVDVLKNGVLEVPRRNRSFTIFGLPPKQWLSLHDGFEEAWLRYLNNNDCVWNNKGIQQNHSQ